MRKIVLFLLCLILIIPNSIAYANSHKNNEEEIIKNVIESFYNTQYDAYLQMEYKDITPYLDMTKIQNQNKVIALKNLTARRKYIYQKGYCYIEKRRFPLEFNYKAIDINGNQASVILEIKLDGQNAYPPFICGGENIIEEGWYAGPGGGSRNWENVEAFWSYMTSYKSIDTPGPRVVVVDSINSLDNGGIMQIDYYNDGRFDHTAILVDKITRKFAQHTENCYRYYSDYEGNKRFFNPYYFREIE